MKRNPQIVSLIAQSNTDGRVVAVYNEIKAIGVKEKLVYTRHFHPSQVGVHRKNREGAIVSGREAMRTLEDINSIGCDPSLWLDATAFEEPAGKDNEKIFLEKCATDDYLPK
jgi:hypothetical protein